MCSGESRVLGCLGQRSVPRTGPVRVCLGQRLMLGTGAVLGFSDLMRAYEHEKARISTRLWIFRAQNTPVSRLWWYSLVNFAQIPSTFPLVTLQILRDSEHAPKNSREIKHRQRIFLITEVVNPAVLVVYLSVKVILECTLSAGKPRQHAA